jgi:hypothetical protein
VHSHTAAHTRALLEHFNWELFDRPAYCSDLFTYQKKWLGSQCFQNNEELMEFVNTWPTLQAADLFDTGIQKLLFGRI